MSLISDQFFWNVIGNHPTIKQATEGRIFNPDRPEIDDKEDRIPYIIIRFEGTQQNIEDKDWNTSDLDTVSLLVVADEREALGNLATLVRDVIDNALQEVMNEDDEMGVGYAIEDYSFSAGAVEYDIMKPCCYQALTYQIETTKRK